MEPKKSQKANIENKRGMLFQIGLVTALAIVLVAFEWTVFEGSGMDLGELKLDNEEEELMPVTQQEITPPPARQPEATQIEIVEDDEEIEDEMDIDDSEIDEETVIEVVEIEETVEEPEIFTIVEKMPSYPGGEKALFKYLGDNIKYPAMAKDAGITGKVFVNFVVNETGKITDVKVLRGIGGGCDEEAMRVIKNMPKWNAGKQRGKAVKVSYNLPIKFTLH